MIPQNVMVGSLVIALCLLLLLKNQWFLENTSKGQRLIRLFGSGKAGSVLKGLAVAGMIFGWLLAAGIIRPIQWK